MFLPLKRTEQQIKEKNHWVIRRDYLFENIFGVTFCYDMNVVAYVVMRYRSAIEKLKLLVECDILLWRPCNSPSIIPIFIQTATNKIEVSLHLFCVCLISCFVALILYMHFFVVIVVYYSNRLHLVCVCHIIAQKLIHRHIESLWSICSQAIRCTTIQKRAEQ